jgi:hypothetical protein
MNSSSTVSAEVGLRLVASPQTIVPLTGSLFYSRQDPYAVRIAFHVGLEEPVEWIFARDLLSRGIKGRQGIGDVQVRPSPGPAGGEPGSVLTIELTSPDGARRASRPRPGKSPTSCAGPTRSSPTAGKAATSTSTPN